MAEPTARLSDIEVDEVSAVDRAANQRRFIVIKRDNTGDAEGVNKNAAGADGADENAAKNEAGNADGAAPRAGDSAAAAGGEAQAATTEKDENATAGEPPAAGGAGGAGAGSDAAAGAAETEAKKDEGGAGDGSQSAGSDAAAQVDKASPMHEQLAREAADAIIAQAEKVMDAANAMSPADAYAALDAMWDLLWAFRQSATVATLTKAEKGAESTGAVDAVLDRIKAAKAAIEKGGKYEDKGKADGMGGGGGDAIGALVQVGNRIAAALERLADGGSMKAKKDEGGAGDATQTAAGAADSNATVSAAVEAVKAEIAKQMGDIAARLNRVEKSHSDPNAVGPAGSTNVNKTGSDDWPFDLAAG